MSDLFYPQAVASNKCNTILTFIPASRYSVSVRADEPMGLLLEATPPSAEPSIKCRFPRHYVPHLERFLWRYYLFYGLYEYFHVKQQSKLNQFGIGFFQRMLVMMNAVLGQLVTTCSKNPNSRSTYFDDYLVTEFIVGCHDPQSVDAWRKNPYHVNLDLERIPPDFLDWKCYDTALGGLLSGQQYQHRLSSVEGATEWNRLLEAVSQWYGKVFCVKRKTADKGNPERLVNGAAGLGIIPTGLAIEDNKRNAEARG